MSDIAVVILTYNEEVNIAQALQSVAGWANEVYILDSFSKDNTVKIAKNYSCSVYQNKFEDYAKQRNYALNCLPITSEWVFFLDADEWMPDDLKHEISTMIKKEPEEDGFYVKWKLIWMGQWIKHGYYPTWILRLFRYGKVYCEERAVNEHLIIEGKKGYLENDFMHEDKKGVNEWIEKHINRATLEAIELIKKDDRLEQDEVKASFFGNQTERKRWVRHYVWERMPPLIRPLCYFFYRYFIKGGFIDGRYAFTYHFLQALWLPMLIDIKYLEMKKNQDS